MAVFLVFIDGVGLGDDSPHNPLTQYKCESFKYMTGDRAFVSDLSPIRESQFLFKPVDACLDVEGLPQSGTGQATLFSGTNAARILGRHFGPFPHSEIQYLLQEQSLFHKAAEEGRSCYFMNAYPEVFFERLIDRDRWTCTTLMTHSAGVELNREEDVRRGKAITAEIVNGIWRERLGIDLPEITPELAADRMLKVGEEKDLVLFEYFITDKVGHAQDMQWAERMLRTLDRFLVQLIRNKGDQHTLVISSDHGNMEDLSQKPHTYNKVPLYVEGPAAPHFFEATNISDVTNGIVSYFRR